MAVLHPANWNNINVMNYELQSGVRCFLFLKFQKFQQLPEEPYLLLKFYVKVGYWK